MIFIRILSIGLGIVTGLGVLVAAGPAKADWDHDGRHRGWRHHGWERPWGPPAVVVAPRRYYYAPYYAPPPVVYAPPPVYYAPPPPAYYAPGASFGFTIR